MIFRAIRSVACPHCKAHPGEPCQSTGGGNPATVTTHRAREQRVADWTEAQSQAAAKLVTEVDRSGGWLRAPDGTFDVTEAAAAPIVVKPAKQPTPKGVRLSEQQAERIEWAAMRGGQITASTAHFHGDAADRQSVQALAAKGILAEKGLTSDGYDRIYELTDFGWQVYQQHRLIIRR